MIKEYNQLEEKDWKRIKSALAITNGKALVLVHPFYATGSKAEMKKLKEVKGQDVLDYLFELKKELKQWNGPVFVMVEEDKIPAMKEILKHEKKDVIIVPTEPGTPTPHGVDPGREWKAFLERLKREGLKKVFLGGELYYKAEAGETGCVSGARRLWSKEIAFEKIGLVRNPRTGGVKPAWVPEHEIGRTGIETEIKENITFPGKRLTKKRRRR